MAICMRAIARFLLRLDKAEEHVGGARCALTFASGWIEMDDHPGRRHGCRMRRHRLRPAPGCGRRRTRPQHDKWHRRCEAMVPVEKAYLPAPCNAVADTLKSRANLARGISHQRR